ncbi:N-methyl-L-tryptophan oxidase [Nannocystaceae bacterium ST9]
MSERVIVVGGGTMGLAAAWALSRRGFAVELLERFDHVHGMGSHGGHTRAFRHAYHEGADYVGLVRRADLEWTALSERVGEPLLVRCGLVEFGAPDDPEFMAANAALREHEVAHEAMSAREAMRRWPFTMPEHWQACLAPESGYLRVKACFDAFRREAEQAGARLRHGVRVRSLELEGPRPSVVLDEGTRLTADHVVVCAGAWSPTLLPASLFGAQPARVLRRVLAWTMPAAIRRPALRELPVWAAFAREGFFYGFPDGDEGVSGCKLACHNLRDDALAFMDEPVDPETVDRGVHERDLAPLREFIDRHFPAAHGEFVHASVCLYTQTRSGDFWIDRHPDHPRVVVAAGFSGHGFKFASAIGVALAELVERGESELALPRFRAPAHD